MMLEIHWKGSTDQNYSRESVFVAAGVGVLSVYVAVHPLESMQKEYRNIGCNNINQHRDWWQASRIMELAGSLCSISYPFFFELFSTLTPSVRNALSSIENCRRCQLCIHIAVCTCTLIVLLCLTKIAIPTLIRWVRPSYLERHLGA